MKNIETNKRNIIAATLILLLGLFLGWLFFGGSDEAPEEKTAVSVHDHENEQTIWTCSMHPQIRQNEPGNCPICGMELIPLEDSGSGSGATGNFETEMSQAAIQLGNIQTSVVTRQAPEKTIYMPGKVEADERLVESVTSRFPGRVERLYVNFTGQEVARGQRLASIYSPALVTAQKELFEAAKFKESNPSFYTAAVNKLKLWDLSENQINNILESREPIYYFDIRSKQAGTVLEKKVETGDYLKEGQALFQISNLNKVWVVFDAYESDLAWVKEGDKIKFTVKSVPGQSFESEVTFIDPVIQPSTRVAKVRTEFKNTNEILKPGMFAQGIVQADISKKQDALTIPKSAVLWTGKRAIVYVKKPDTEKPVFEFREIELGPEAGDYYLVNSGLKEGEEVVTNGTFKVDAAAQLQGKASMMSPDKENEETSSTITDKDKKILMPIFMNYLELKDALVKDDFKSAKSSVNKLQKNLQAIEISQLSKPLAANWQNQKPVIGKQLENLNKSEDIKELRDGFDEFSETMINLARKGSPMTGMYVLHCPMADSNKGADWLSMSSEIKNPYYGSAMIGCGEVKSTIK